MSFPNTNQDLLDKITNISVAEMISEALRAEHKQDSSSVKQIRAKTEISRHTISKWYQAVNAPKSAHLLELASIYPEVLKGVLFMIGRQDLWRYSVLKGIPRKMGKKGDMKMDQSSLYSDSFVHMDVIVNRELAIQMNERQLWFVSELQNGRRIRANDITKVWDKTLRTARRDILEIIERGIIEYCGANKNGHYRLCE